MSKGQQILVVDDDESIRELFECIIEDLGFNCTTAADGESGIDKAKNGSFDLIFLDIKMPKLNGIETLREIRKFNPDVPVTMMTGFSVEDLVQDAMNLKAAEVLYKPFDVETLENLIKEKLDAVSG